MGLYQYYHEKSRLGAENLQVDKINFIFSVWLNLEENNINLQSLSVETIVLKN